MSDQVVEWPTLIPTAFTMIFGVGLVIATAVFSWIALSRTGFTRSMVVLESIRMLLVILVAVTINQPEWLKEFFPEEDPVLVVMWDQSGSMDTKDVVDGSNRNAKKRADWIQEVLVDDIWAPYEEDVEVVMVPFSSDLNNPSKGSDLNAALADVNEKYKNLRGVVLLTDGRWNIGDSPTVAATQLRMKDVPVFTVAVGSESALPDIAITALDAPTFGVVRKPTRIPYSFKSTMGRNVTAIVSLSSSDGDEMTETVDIPAKGTLQGAFTWKPKKTGEYTLTLTIPKQDGEAVTTNNTWSAPISIRKESLKVLVVESFPRWEYRYLRNALSRDPGVDVSCLLFHPQLDKVGGGKDYIDEFPSTLEELGKYDVIMLGDVGIGDGQLTLEDCERIKGLVENTASGLIFMPGFRGRQFTLMETALQDLYPVVLDDAQQRGWGSQIPSQFQLTEMGRESLLTKLADNPEANASVWRSLAGFQWYAPVQRAKAGTQVLAVHATDSNDNGRIPLLVTKTYGAGKILFMGTDGAWRWREGVEDKYHYRFWGQVARWMAYQRNMAGGDSLRFFYTPDRPKVGDTIALNANATTVGGEPLQSGTVNVQIIAPSGNTDTIKLAPQNSEDEWGLFTGFFSPEENGIHQAIITCRESGATTEAIIDVQGTEREKIGQPINQDVLSQIADITRGKMVSTEEFGDLLDEISELPEPEARQIRIPIWSHWAWASSIILLLTVFWIGRKVAGKI